MHETLPIHCRMPAFDRVLAQARQTRRRIVLPEGDDRRILEACVRLRCEAIAEPVLVGDTDTVRSTAIAAGIDLADIEIIDPARSPRREHYRRQLIEQRRPRHISERKSQADIVDPLVFACMMVSGNDADGCVAGAAHTTATVIGSSLRYVGQRPDVDRVSSFFIMLTLPQHPVQDVMLMADCALIVDPDSDTLASIAAATGDNARHLLGIEPRVAMLSFSTHGSARHAQVNKVVAATARLRKLRPDWHVIGEVQFDAAVIPAVLAAKSDQVDDTSACNVLIFPGLEAGNIGYKIMQRFGNVQAIGPILQGLRKPVNDLSRGCSVDDILHMVAVTAAQCD